MFHHILDATCPDEDPGSANILERKVFDDMGFGKFEDQKPLKYLLRERKCSKFLFEAEIFLVIYLIQKERKFKKLTQPCLQFELEKRIRLYVSN